MIEKSSLHIGFVPSKANVFVSKMIPHKVSESPVRESYNATDPPKSIVNPVNSSFNPKNGTPKEQSVQYTDPMLNLLIPLESHLQSPLIGPTLLPKHDKHPY